MASTVITASQVNRAGQTLRRWMREEIGYGANVDEAFDAIWRYRATHAYPLAKAITGLRSVVRTELGPIEVTERLKRMTTILDNLVREPTMQLARMQDIGPQPCTSGRSASHGCRSGIERT